MQPIDHATVLITGASRGIGLAIAEEFANHGHNLILVSRGYEELERVAQNIIEKTGVSVTTFPVDLSENGSPERLCERVKQAGLTVDILVNNAGVGMSGKFAKGNYLCLVKMLKLNMLALSQLTHLFLQPMLKRKCGRILNIGSVVAYFSGAPNWSAYGASKNYVRAFSIGLSKELKGSGVAATVVSPGPTATDFVQTADAADMLVYRAMRGPTVEHIAKVAYRACQYGKVSAIPGWFNKILAFLGELHPRRIAFEVFTFLSKKKDRL
jgi:short-subunit dehydrogenase